MSVYAGNGPREPEWVRVVRVAYYEPLHRLLKLEDRICQTDSGMAWLYRVKAR